MRAGRNYSSDGDILLLADLDHAKHHPKSYRFSLANPLEADECGLSLTIGAESVLSSIVAGVLK